MITSFKITYKEDSSRETLNLSLFALSLSLISSRCLRIYSGGESKQTEAHRSHKHTFGNISFDMNEQPVASHPLCSIVLVVPCFNTYFCAEVNHGDRRFTIESMDFEGWFRIQRSTDQSP